MGHGGLLELGEPSGVLGPSGDARHRHSTHQGLRCEVRDEGRRGQAARTIRAARRRRRTMRSGRRTGDVASGGQGAPPLDPGHPP